MAKQTSSAPRKRREKPTGGNPSKKAASLKKAAGKQRGRPFQAGKSGNPRGRPRGVPNKATQAVREMARELLDDPLAARGESPAAFDRR